VYVETDITQHWRFQQLLLEAAQYQCLRQIFESDPKIGPATAELLARCFRGYRDDAAILRGIAHQTKQSAASV
jgi:hypothetical protein